MANSELILAPRRGGESDAENFAPAFPIAGAGVIEALETARRSLPYIERAVALRDAAAISLQSDAGRQPWWIVLPPIAAAAVSATTAAAAAILLAHVAPGSGVGAVPTLALAADVAALGGLAMIGLRQVADKSRGRTSRLAWAALGASTCAGILAFALDAAADGLAALANVAGIALAAAAPWLFARLTTGECRRLTAELKAASAELAAAQTAARSALAAARAEFESEALTIAAATFDGTSDGHAEARRSWRGWIGGPRMAATGSERAEGLRKVHRPERALRIVGGVDDDIPHIRGTFT